MMKSSRTARRTACIFAAVTLGAGLAWAHGNDQADAKATIDGAHVVIHYGRPLLKGRDILKLIEPGKLWRMGADVPTTIETDSGLDFGGTKVPKGKYVLLARLSAPGQWTLIVSREPILKYEPSAKVAEVPMKLDQDVTPADEMSILLAARGAHGQLEVHWGTLRLTAAFTRAR